MRVAYIKIASNDKLKKFVMANITLIVLLLMLIFMAQISKATGSCDAAIEFQTSGDYVAPEGYKLNVTTDMINNFNCKNTSVLLSSAEIGSSYCYSVACDAGGILLTGTGTIVDSDFEIKGIDVSKLPDGNLTYCVVLTDVWGNVGDVVTSTVVKSQTDISNFKKQNSIVAHTTREVAIEENTAQIGYYLPDEGIVSLTVFDMLGDVVKVILNDEAVLEGAHAYMMSELELAAGLYFCKLNVWSLSNNVLSTITKKMIVE